MKERWIGVGLGVGAALTLGVVWTDSAQAFSLGSEVIVENFLRDATTLKETGFQGPTSETVIDGQEANLIQFGGIWNIDLGDNSISFTLNSAFGNVTSGDDVYSFQFLDPYQMETFPTIEIFSFTAFASDKSPFARFTGRDELEVVFPLGFAPDGLSAPNEGSIPMFSTGLPIEPHAVPTPALLPGLMGMVWGIWRRRHNDQPE